MNTDFEVIVNPKQQIDGSISQGITWNEVFGKPSTFTPSNHIHPISDIVDLQDDLNLKANSATLTAHISNISNPHSVTKIQMGLGNVLDVVQEPALGNPSINGQVLTSTTGGVRSWATLPTGFSGSYTDLTNVPSTFAPSAHTHSISDITSLQAVLNTKALASDLSTHTADTGNPHAVTKSQVGLSNVTNDAQVKRIEMGAASGVATLDGAGLIPSTQLPPIAIVDTSIVASQAAMLALTAKVGDIAIRTDLNKSFILKTADPTILEHWQELLTPTDFVLSVNGYTGAVSLTKSDLSLGNVENTALSTWAGSTNLTTLGTVTIGTFSGTLGAISGASLTALTATNITNSTTVGRAILNLTNPSVISFVKIAADNSVSTRTPVQVLSDIGAQPSGSYAASGANTDIISVLLNQTGLVLKGGDSNAVTIKVNETLLAGRTLSLVLGDANRSLTFSTDATIGGTHSGTSSGTNTGDQTITLTGNVTGSGTGSFAATIANSAVTLAKQADVATASVFYRKTAGTGAPEVQTLATLKTDLGLTGTNSGDQTAGNGITVTGLSVAIDTSVTIDKTTAQTLTNKDLSGAGNTFPTFNQNTTGSAAKWTTARNLAGNSIDGSSDVAFVNKFIVQGTTDSGLSAAQFLGSLATGILKNTTTTGVLSIAVAGDFPTLNQNTSGSAASLSISGQTGLITLTGLTSTNRIKTVRDAADTILELGGSYTPTGTWTSLTMVTPVLGTPTSGTLTNCTFPTLNQNTTGSAAKWTTARAIYGNSVDGSGDVTAGIPKTFLLNGINNGNTTRQSQIVVSATSYYITSSNINLPATLKDGMIVGTKFVWRVHMDKTAAGTGTFQIIIYRGVNGSTSDTADITQTIGTQTAAVDNMVMDVTVTIATTGATGSYFWSICPMQQAASATGFGIATGTTGLFTGTVSSVALNTASLIFGLGFKATTGTPTISIPMVQAQALNID